MSHPRIDPIMVETCSVSKGPKAVVGVEVLDVHALLSTGTQEEGDENCTHPVTRSSATLPLRHRSSP